MTRDNCKFRFYCDGVCTALVSVIDGVVTTERYTDDWYSQPFGLVPDRRITRQTLDTFFSEHCIPEHRANLKDYLQLYGLDKYNAFKICRITNGEMVNSQFRIEWLDA